ncbi:MAG: class I SAM-dependent methyltransferase [Candidatus Thorarchaeota archaeon]|nr:MAG: class I SAM-dependent methyltransferase [Candidatus Thorarchaeota archaeon]
MSDHHPEIDMSEVYQLPPQEVNLADFPADEEWILDVGGGGEGIIGRMKGRQVVAIDRRRPELEGTANEALKLVMDARELQFLENSFGTVTLFFTLMYIPFGDLDTIFSEVARVLKPGGALLIWDVNVEVPRDTEEKYFMVPLTVTFPDGTKKETGYGSKMRNQDMGSFVSAAEKHGFEVVDHDTIGLTFYTRLALRKG